ncbi:helix-turn-helix transcriptional regulator [Vallitalea pronyensis]|uniref:Helix-turn-helix transcriptional regulator n=1 Tax=Vallitalea pronyensis TaxID=1348613 RepID=A0A8J8MIU6_9FIRM|nr:AraC family transcriptional regulator [Vallitalea pronyensis]QUI22434.1 helix-turn-helix transcriptional regulator [Vallitalea pronyensis]
MDDLNVKLICGGFNRCLPKWSMKYITNEHDYKLYFPVEGEASIRVDGTTYTLKPGHVYFINAHKLQAQLCSSYLSVYWLHFIPHGLMLNKYLEHLAPVYIWEKDKSLLRDMDYTCIPKLFHGDLKPPYNTHETAPIGLTCYVTSLLLLCISDMIKAQQKKIDNMTYHHYDKLKPAIDFMHDNYHKNLKLEEIAGKTFLNPIYFLRLFKQNFKITPHQYLLKKRLDEACRMLRRTHYSISDISQRLGFCNQFYFSKTFKRHFGKTPSEYRQSKPIP